ncbi:glycosyltransferase family 2 protein, partial [Acidisphaera rubrifaciens]|uniref:glycosyltransferase family 2 protein n=1 Tax=Acidisphaera rubrifaciens TaxID=50715 RepID=UPI0006624A50
PWSIPRRFTARRALLSAPAPEAAAGPAFGPAQAEYLAWIAAFDTITEPARIDIRARLRALPARPVISVLMPVYNADPVLLHAAIVSVRDQIYQNWELCIADDASTAPAVREVLERMAAEDARIKVAFRPENGHIARATNTALDLASGEWVALLDQDDLLPPHALSCMAEAIVAHPAAGVLYSDEDKIDAAGRRFDPYFKPDWNYELFLSQNMVSHFGVYRAALVREVGGMRPGFEGSQDHDLALRCIERLPPGGVVHVPRVLYHWRAHAASTAHSADSKPYARDSGRMAIAEHLRRRGFAATVEVTEHAHYRIRYALPDAPPMVSIVIPARNGLAITRTCIESIRDHTTYPSYEIVLVDNGSDDPDMLAWLAELPRTVPRVRVLRDDRPFNYSALNNAGVAAASGEVICLLNNDIEITQPGWLDEMVAIALQPGVGAVGARLWYPDGTLQHGGVTLGVGGIANHAFYGLRRGDPGYFGRAVLMQSYSAVTAACLVVRAEAYHAIGGFDAALPVAFNDVDFCLRLRAAGLRNVWTPFAEAVHHESATRGVEDTAEKKMRFQREVAMMHARWDDILQADPAYNPNLTLKALDFGLAWPPRVPAGFRV